MGRRECREFKKKPANLLISSASHNNHNGDYGDVDADDDDDGREKKEQPTLIGGIDLSVGWQICIPYLRFYRARDLQPACRIIRSRISYLALQERGGGGVIKEPG